MRTLIALSLLLSPFSLAHAAGDACGKFLPCGTYEGKGNWYDVNNKPLYEEGYAERIEIAAAGEQAVNLKVWIYSGERGEPWADATMKFEENGMFTFTQNKGGYTFGAGFCAHETCTVAFRPAWIEEGRPPFANDFVNVLRFEGGKLYRFNMVSNEASGEKLKFQKSELTKQ